MVCSIKELISLEGSVVKVEQKVDKTWSSFVEHLTNPQLTPQPKLNKKIIVEAYDLVDILLYKSTVLSDTDTSSGKVKQLVITESLVPNVLKFLHDVPTSSHPGKDKTYKQVKPKYYWPLMNMWKNLSMNMWKNCLICADTQAHQRQCLNIPYQTTHGSVYTWTR